MNWSYAYASVAIVDLELGTASAIPSHRSCLSCRHREPTNRLTEGFFLLLLYMLGMAELASLVLCDATDEWNISCRSSGDLQDLLRFTALTSF